MDLICDNLGKRYGLNWIIKGFSHRFDQGNTYAIVGPNGSGKSTLLQLLAGNIIPSRGQITYLKGSKKIADYRIFRDVSICTPYLELIEENSLEEMIEFHFQFKKIRSGISLKEVPSILLLEKDRHKFIKNFSSGMKQRVKLGLAILSETPLLFLDEPGSNLDENSFQWYLNLLSENKSDRTIFIASNKLAEYEPFSTEAIDVMKFKG